jgi:adenosylmethionine-8-amino-7-oxononanoate aminotransferase
MRSSESLFEVQPDVLCLAKGLTSGYLPLGATLFSDAFYDVINTPQCENGQLSLGYTYSGHPVSCAAALANIDIIEEEKLCKNVRVLGPLFQEKLSTLSQHEIVGDVRGSHLMAGIELVADRATKTGFDPSVQAASRVAEHCMEMGLVVRPIGNVIVLSPPLIVTEGHCEEMVDILGRSIEAVQSDLEAEGLIPASLRGADPGLVALSGG